MELRDIKSVYFLGAGGIGMSALVRYFLAKGFKVGGYDRVRTQLTDNLENEGAMLHYSDDVDNIPAVFRDKAKTLVVYTPAVPQNHRELTFFREEGYAIYKRAAVLGMLTRSMKGLCVAGTHGKTTTSTMTAHLLHESEVGTNAFLGGISKNYNTNYLYSEKSPYVVIEADEFDRSFHQLLPWATVITATDADHLDIYGTEEAYRESFEYYTSLIAPGGTLICHQGLPIATRQRKDVRLLTYSRSEGDFHAENERIGDGEIVFDFVSPLGDIKDICLGVPVSINIENGIAAMALAQLSGVKENEIRLGMATYEGVVRRFDFKIKEDNVVLLSDYAHHPVEIRRCVESLREVFTGRRLTAIFQPHLYTRTRDFYKEFAESLSLLDEVVLTDIYPAREKPISGVSSRLIFDRLRPGIGKYLIKKEEAVDFVKNHDTDVWVILGAGNLDDDVESMEKVLRQKHNV